MTGTVAREIERKYELVSELELSDLVAETGYDSGAEAEEFELRATYYDTVDLRLLRAGVTLRRRTGGDDAGWHVKLPVDADSREEVRLPVAEDDGPPDELVALVRVYSLGKPLMPVAELTTRRRRSWLVDMDGRRIAELVDDQVRSRRLGGPNDSGTGQCWRELEVELAEGVGSSLLEEIEQRLLPLGVRRSSARSKIARVLADRIGEHLAPRPAPSTDDVPDGAACAGEVVVAYLRAQAEALRHFDPLVRRDVPDAVHQMRVAARRMRSALQGFGRVIDRESTRGLITELRWVAGELGAARDTEVMAERFAAILEELPVELRLGPVQAELTRYFQRREAQAKNAALAALDSERYLALHRAIESLLADPPYTRKARRPAATELPKSARRGYRRLRAAMAHVDSLPPGPERELALHEVRKAAKRLRYVTDAVAPAVGSAADLLRTRLKAVQTVLGDHQDTVVARPVLRELGAAAPAGGGNGFTYGLMYGIEQARADQLRRTLPKLWRKMRTRRATRWLAR